MASKDEREFDSGLTGGTDVPGNAVGHVVVDLIHEPLRQRRHGGANRHVAQIAPHGGKIHPSGIDNAVNGISHQNGDI